MSFLFGGGGSKVKPKFTGIQLQTSSQTAALTIAWGANRFAPNIVWYGDFASHKQKQKAGKGGGTVTDYTYTASCIFALCEGGNHATGIQGVGKVWKDQDTSATLSSLGLTLFSGTVPQAPWGYLTSKHPSEAFNYAGVAYLAAANYDLGNQATLPNHSFEVLSQRVGSGWTGGQDADCALIISDFLFNVDYGVMMPEEAVDTVQLLSTPDAPTTGDNSYQTYCRVMGFGLSPVLTDQKEAGSTLDQWTKITNTAIVWTGYCLRFVPYCYETLTGNGVTFVPNTTPVYVLNDDDFVGKANPLQVSRKDPSDCKNQLKLLYSNRSNNYNDAPEPWEDQGLIEQFGKKPGSDFTAKEVTVQDMAVKVVTLMGKRGAYLRNTYTFTLSGAHILIEPMDVVSVVDPALGTVPVQITKIEENDNGELKFTAEEISAGVSTPSSYTPQSGGSSPVNTGASPGPVNTPIIFEPPANLTNGVAEVWAAVSGGNNTTAGQFWGGCQVYVSADGGASYQNIGRVDSPARQGKLTANLAAYAGANPDTTNTAHLTLLMSKGELQSVSSTEAANATTLCYLGGEFLAFETATLTGTNTYDLDSLYRGLYGSAPGAHSTGAPFARLDDNIFEYSLPSDYVGHALKFKFPSFNIWGGALQDLADCVEYDYTPTGEGFKIDAPSSTTLAFTRRTQADGTSIITGTITVGASDGPYLDHYDVQVSVSPYTTWIDVPAISSAGTKTSFEPAIASTNYKARTRAVSSAPEGEPSAWVESSVQNSGGLESAAPNAPTSLIATGGTLSNQLSVTPPASGAPVAGYRWYAIHAASGSFGSAVLIGQTQIPSFIHAGLGVSDTWRYWAVAYNSVGNSTEVGPQNATTQTTGGGGNIEIQEGGTPIVATATAINFFGAGVEVTDEGSGVAGVEIKGFVGKEVPVIRGSDIGSSSASSYNIPFPSGTLAGDLCVIAMAGAWGIGLPSGWSDTGELTGSNFNGRVLFKNLTSGDIATGYVTVTTSGSFNHVWAVCSFVGSGVVRVPAGASRKGSGSATINLNSNGNVQASDRVLLFGSNRENSFDTINVGTEIETISAANASGVLNTYVPSVDGVFAATFSYGTPGSGNYQAIIAIEGVPSGISLDRLDDVDTTGVAGGQALVYDDVTDKWSPGNPTGAVDIDQEGVPVAPASTLNFTGAGVVVTDAGGGQVDVAIPGGGGGGGGGTTGTARASGRAWRLRGFRGGNASNSSDGIGYTLVNFRDALGTALIPTGGTDGFSNATDTGGGWAINAAFDGSSAASHGWYSGNTQAGHVFTSPYLGYDFITPVAPASVEFAPLTGFTWTVGEQVAVEYSDDLEFWNTLAILEPRAAADHVVERYYLPDMVIAAPSAPPKNLLRKIPTGSQFPTLVTSGSTPVLTDDPVEGLLYNSGTAATTYAVHTGVSGDFTVTARIKPNPSTQNSNSGTGICLYDSTNNKTISWVLYKSGSGPFFFGAARWTGTSLIGSIGSNTNGTSGFTQYWVRIRVVSGVAYFDYSADGVQWLNVTNYTISGHMAALNGCGLFTFSNGNPQFFRTEWYQDPTVNPPEISLGGIYPNNNIIGEVVTSGSQASVTFTNIPQTYRNLKLLYTARAAGTAGGTYDTAMKVVLNGDTGSNYSTQQTFAAGSGGANVRNTGQAYFGGPQIATNNTNAGLFDSGEVHFGNYANAVNQKSMWGQGSNTDSASPSSVLRMMSFSGRWSGTAAVTSITITLTASGAVFEDGSVLTLIGE